MADTKSTVNIEVEQADRFPKARISYVVWTRQQGKKLRELPPSVVEEPEPGAPAPGPSIADKFNAV